MGPAVAWDLLEAFLAAEFSRAERHLGRLGEVAARRRDLLTTSWRRADTVDDVSEGTACL